MWCELSWLRNIRYYYEPDAALVEVGTGGSTVQPRGHSDSLVRNELFRGLLQIRQVAMEPVKVTSERTRQVLLEKESTICEASTRESE